MAAIHFESDVDNSKLNKGFKESEQTVEDFVKKVEKSGGVIGEFAAQSAKQMKESIAVQKNAIKELQNQIKELENTTKSGGGSYKENLQAQGQLAAAKKNLAGEQATLLAMQKAQVTGNNAEAQSQVPIIGGLWKWALGIGAVTAAMKIGKSIIESTEASAQLFEETIAASTTAVGYFFKAIASGDWSNFWDGLKEATKGAVEFTKEMEKIERRTIEQEVKGAQAKKDIAELRAGTFDKGIENNAKLIENTTKIIEIQKKDYENQASIAKDKYEKTRNQAALENKMSADKIESLTFEYTKNKQLLELGEKYNEIQGKIGVGGTTGRGEYLKKTRPEKYTELQTEMAMIESELQNSFQTTGAEAGKLAEAFEKPTIKALKSLADLKKSQIELEGLAKIGSKFDQRALEAAINKRDAAQVEYAKKAKEDAELENRIKVTQEAMKSASGQELDNLAKKIVLFQKELDLRNGIVSSAIAAAENKPIVSIKAKKVGGTGKGFGGPLALITDEIMKEENKRLKDQGDEIIKTQKKIDEDAEDAAKRKQEIQQEIIGGARQLTGELIDQLGLSEKEAKQWQNLADIMANAASGNWIGAATGMLSQILADLSGANIDESNRKLSPEEKRTKALDETNKALERQLNLLQSLSGNDYLRISAKQAEDLKKANAESLSVLQKLSSGSGGDLLGFKGIQNFSFQDFIKATTVGMDTLLAGKVFLTLNEEQQTYFDSILENTKELADLMQSTFQEALGFQSADVSDSIFTGIWDGLKLGKNALGDFSESFGDLMKKALMQSITEGFNLKLTEGWMQQFTEFMKGGLTDEERAKLEQDYIKLIQEEQIKVDEVKKITDKYTTSSANAQSSLTGQIKGVSEDTASMIAGRLMAVNNDMKKGLEIGYDSLDVMTMSVGHLDKIQKNTFDTVQQLIVSNSELVKMNATLNAKL